MTHPGNTGPKPTNSSEFYVRLQQVFSIATQRLRDALELEAMAGGGYVQGFVGLGDIPVPTQAFKLREKLPRIIEGKQTIGEWIVHIPEDQADKTDHTFVDKFWLDRVIRGTDQRTSVLYRFDEDGSTLVRDDTGVLVGLEDLTDASFDISMEGFEAEFEAMTAEQTEILDSIAKSMELDFELVPFAS